MTRLALETSLKQCYEFTRHRIQQTKRTLYYFRDLSSHRSSSRTLSRCPGYIGAALLSFLAASTALLIKSQSDEETDLVKAFTASSIPRNAARKEAGTTRGFASAVFVAGLEAFEAGEFWRIFKLENMDRPGDGLGFGSSPRGVLVLSVAGGLLRVASKLSVPVWICQASTSM